MAFTFFKKKPVDRLIGYPCYKQPFATSECTLTDTQADANFDYLLTNKASRISALADFLTGYDIDVHAGMNATSPDSLVTQLYQWSGEHWPRYFDKAIHNEEHWIASTKQDDNLIYSVIMDTAIVIGELIIKHRPTYCWNLDRAPGNKVMASYNRCVLTAPWLPETDRFVVIDIESRIAQRFLHAHYSGQRHEELWLRLLHACVSGGAEGAHLNY